MRSLLTKEEQLELKEVLAQQWGTDSSMVDYCLRDSFYIKHNDTFICIGSKQSIDTTMYYDDETPRPTVDEESFKAYNSNNFIKQYKPGKTFAHIQNLQTQPQYIGNKTDGKLLGLTYDARGEFAAMATDVDADLLDKINTAVDIVNEAYTKRLAAYWKRFSNKVTTNGYWANR